MGEHKENNKRGMRDGGNDVSSCIGTSFGFSYVGGKYSVNPFLS